MAVGMQLDCFGFFAGDRNSVCARCRISKRCKSVLITDGFDVLGQLANTLANSLPEGRVYTESDQLRVMVDQLVNPKIDLSESERELLNLMGKRTSTSALDTGDI